MSAQSNTQAQQDSPVAVVGTGTFGCALAQIIAQTTEVLWLARDEALATTINTTHTNPRHLPQVELSERIHATADPYELALCTSFVIAVPSSYLRSTLERLREAHVVAPTDTILLVTKGIEPGTHLLMDQVCAQILGHLERIAALSGPTHAEELALKQITCAVIAAHHEEVALYFKQLLTRPYFRLYVAKDMVGIEVCGALKNVIAIASGIAEAAGAGDNTRAALMTRGIAELGRFVYALGGDPQTCMGLAGMGDLVVTCTSEHSRNRSFGEAFVKGSTLEAYERNTHMVVEGARACLSAHELAQDLKICAPVTSAVYDVLYNHVSLTQVLSQLTQRVAHAEFYGMEQNS